ncbi:nucleotidyltransferase domain-containing protein [Mycobacterium sp. BMJ-28]
MIEDRWDAWSPADVARRLSDVSAPWCVAAGWAVDLFVGEITREHDDVEIAVPAASFDEIAEALPGYKWDVVGDGRVWPYPEQVAQHFQTWLREPATGIYRLDVFREPHVDGRWVCRRDPTITVPYAELILRTDDGIPYVIPEVALLFKAKHRRAKDEADFTRVLPELGAVRRSRLHTWLARIHPGHPWIDVL